VYYCSIATNKILGVLGYLIQGRQERTLKYSKIVPTADRKIRYFPVISGTTWPRIFFVGAAPHLPDLHLWWKNWTNRTRRSRVSLRTSLPPPDTHKHLKCQISQRCWHLKNIEIGPELTEFCRTMWFVGFFLPNSKKTKKFKKRFKVLFFKTPPPPPPPPCHVETLKMPNLTKMLALKKRTANDYTNIYIYII